MALAVGFLFALGPTAQGQTPPPIVYPNMTYYTVAKSGDPFQQSTFTTLNRVAVGRVAGEDYVAFHSNYTGPGGVGIWSQDVTGGGALSLVARPGISVTGSCGTIALIDSGFPPHINASGQVAFFATMSGTGCPPSGSLQSLILRPSPPSSLVLMAQEGMGPPPGPTFTLLNEEFGLGTTGEIAFRAGYASGTGVWSTAGGIIFEIARTGVPAPGGSAGEVFNLFGGSGMAGLSIEPEYNSSLTSAFRPTLSGGIAGSGVYTGNSTSLQFITDNNHNAPGIAPATKFSGFESVAINATGTAAFRGCAGVSCAIDGIWKGASNPTLVAIAIAGNAAPGKDGSSIGTFNGFNNPVINAAGDTAFRASLVGGDSGIWAENLHAPGLRLITKKGDQLRGTNKIFDTFDGDLVINDAHQLVFTAHVKDSMQNTFRGVFFVTPDVITVFKVVLEGEFFDVGTPQVPDIKQVQFPMGIDFFPGVIGQGVSGLNNAGSLAYRLTFTDFTRAVILTTIGT